MYVIHKQLWRYEVEEKLHLGVRQPKWFNTTVVDNRLTNGGKVISLTRRLRFTPTLGM
jgi:hypothetical protein